MTRKKSTYALFLILLTGLGLRIYCALDPMLHPWDERYHALVAKNMMEHPLEPRLYAKTQHHHAQNTATLLEIPIAGSADGHAGVRASEHPADTPLG